MKNTQTIYTIVGKSNSVEYLSADKLIIRNVWHIPKKKATSNGLRTTRLMIFPITIKWNEQINS